MSEEITIQTNFGQIGGEYKQARKEYLKLEKKAQEYIEKEIIDEKKELDIALSKYNDKMNKITSSSKYKEMEENANSYSQEMSKNLIKAKNSFIKVKEDILKKDWSDEKKNKKIQELFDYVLGKLYTEEEVLQFKSMMSSIVLI